MTPMTPSGPRHPSVLALHELQTGALPAAERDQVSAHLAACAACAGVAATLAADQRHFAAEVLPRTMAAVAGGRTRRWTLVLVPALAATVCALWLAPRPQLRAKGDATLTLYAARGEQVVMVADGSALAPGDRIRFVLRPGGLGYALVASVDGIGRITVYHPFEGVESGRIEPSPRVELPGSIVLDRSPGPERIFALLSRHPLQATQVREALTALGRGGPPAIRANSRLAVPADAQGTVLIEKR
jgi:hypothetical protein